MMMGFRKKSAAAFVFAASCLALNTSCAGSASPATGDVQLRPTCSVANHTPRGVHVDKDTDAIQGAIDECASYLNGGVVVFDKRVYVTGTLQLKSNVDLHITKGTVLLGSSNAMDYPFIPKAASLLSNNQRVLIYSVDAENVSISGDGIIDGNGASNPAWNGSGKLDGWGYRPLLILLSKTNHISFRQITIQNSANWTVVLNQDSNIMIDGVTVKAGANAKSENLDGIDLVDSKNVEIKNSVIDSQDDSIVLKSVLSAKNPNAGVSGVHVHNVNVSSIGANGLKIGTSSAGPVSDITFDHVNILGTQYAAMEVESVDGGHVSNVTFSNINVEHSASLMYLILSSRVSDLPGSIDHVTFDTISASNMKLPWTGEGPGWAHAKSWDLHAGWGNAISGTMINGLVYSPTNIVLKNVTLKTLGGATQQPGDPKEYPYASTGSKFYPDVFQWKALPAYGFYIRHVNGLTLENVSVEKSSADVRPAILMSKDVTYSTKGAVAGIEVR